MTTMSEGVMLLVGGVILEPVPVVCFSLDENLVHILDERWWSILRRYLIGGVGGGDPSQPNGGRLAGGLAGRLGIGGKLRNGLCCRAQSVATEIMLAAGVVSWILDLAACSGLLQLALLDNYQYGVRLRWRMALAATTLWDILACSRLRWVA